MLPEPAPFTSTQRQALDSVLPTLDALQRGWLSGFLAATGAIPAAAPATTGPVAKLTVLYGTESGNSEELAVRATKEAKKRGFKANMINMADIPAADLAKFSNLLLIVSTWGDGEPPETATNFYNEFMSADLTLTGVKFSVCALGDTSYEKFCQTGKDMDARLEALGATRIAPRTDCDVDYEEAYTAWLDAVLNAIQPAAATLAADPRLAIAVSATEYGKKHPFPAELAERVLLNGEGSAKETHHIELALEGSGLTYEPGDSLAIHPVNAPDVIKNILLTTGLTGNEEIEVKNIGPKLLADALREDFDITALSRSVLKKIAELTRSATLEELLDDANKEKLKAYIEGRQIVDALADFAIPGRLTAAELASIFRKLPPRLYSIASSPLAHPDEVHLTVAAVRYHTHGRDRKGVASTYLPDLIKPGDCVPVFVQPNKNFRLPADGTTPIIMVGPGTGIAPFRAFVEHRAALGTTGKNWLIFGDQHYTYDFLYQLEWQDHLKSGVLTRLDVAFSRDQPEKVYVQHRMIEQGADLYAWLEEGAHFYVCGDASRMAHDVHEALISIVENHGALTRENAEAYVENLKKSKRYQRDVY